MKHENIKKIIKEALSEILAEEERDQYGRLIDPDISYGEEYVKGELRKVVATLKGKKSEQFTKVANDLLRVEELKKELEALAERIKQSRIRDEISDLMGAESGAWTRILQTVGQWEILMSIDPKETISPQYKLIADKMAKTSDEMTAFYKVLKTQLVTKTQKPPSLKTKKLGEGIFSGFLSKVKHFFRGIDKRIAKTNKHLEWLKRHNQ